MTFENFGAHDLIDIAVIVANVGVAFVTSRIKIELAELKVWIFENFERRSHPRD